MTTKEEIGPDYYEPPPPPPKPPQEKSVCGKFFATLAALLMIAWAAASGYGLGEGHFDVPETHADSSISPSGLGGDDSLDNSFD